MSITILVPTALRRFVDNAAELVVEADRVGMALAEAVNRYPRLQSQLFGGNGQLRSFILVFVNSKNIKHLQQEHTALAAGDRISLIPAIAGG